MQTNHGNPTFAMSMPTIRNNAAGIDQGIKVVFSVSVFSSFLVETNTLSLSDGLMN